MKRNTFKTALGATLLTLSAVVSSVNASSAQVHYGFTSLPSADASRVIANYSSGNHQLVEFRPGYWSLPADKPKATARQVDNLADVQHIERMIGPGLIATHM